VIDRAIGIAVKTFRYSCGLRLSPVWELDDLRQTAALHYLETGNEIEAARLTWNEFRRNISTYNRTPPGIPDDLQSRFERGKNIPERLLAKCSDRERAALCLAYECDMSGPEIAEHLQTSWKAAKLLLTRGRAKVRKVIEA
jgi:DNA-directed RNA polymerase specialized sigma24 family protein